MGKIKYFTQKELKKLFKSIERQKDYPFVLIFIWGLLYAMWTRQCSMEIHGHYELTLLKRINLLRTV